MTCVKSDFAFSTGKVLINSNGVCFKSLRCTLFCKGLWEKHEDVSKRTEPRKSFIWLSGFFVFPRVGKCSQWHFLFFPILGKSFFADFLFSQCWESRFSAFFDFPPRGKADFLLIFVHRTPTKASFCRFLSIAPRIWVVFRENVCSGRIWTLLEDTAWAAPLPGDNSIRYCLFLRHAGSVPPSPCDKGHSALAGCVPFFMNRCRVCHSGRGWRQGSCHSRFPPCQHRRGSSRVSPHVP